MKNPFATEALRYALSLKWPVLPLVAEWKDPVIPGREGGRGVYDATTDASTIEEWVKRWPEANIGIACGEASGFVVLDVDPRNGGDTTMRKLAAQGYAFPAMPKARTGNGGWHLFLRWQPGIGGSKDRLGKGVDVKSTGGYIVAAPSWTRASEQGPGGPYRWEVSPFDVPPPPMPMWLVQKLTPPPRQAPRFDGPVVGDIAGLVRFVQRATEGERNNSLYWAACRARELIAQGIVGEATATSALANAAVATGHDVPGALRTIHSGLHGPASSGERHG